MNVPQRASHWQLRTRRLDFPARPLVMGILNVTPDSFSDGGQFAGVPAAIEHGLRMAAEGADLIDVGGESTRPYSQPVEASEELRRVLPVVQALVEQTGLPISIDTSKAAVAREALAAGAEIINDVTALAGDEQMIETALDAQAAVCAMHMPGTPQTMQDNPAYQDVVADVYDYLRQRRDALLAAGILPSRIALDPGIGFGKTHEHNVTLLAHCRRFHGLGCPLMVGHSRKGFIGKIIGDKMADRTAGTVGVTLALASQGVGIVRVHDVAANLHALKLFFATGGVQEV
ncbi:MAG TPA: dihydropteroate synthase [Pirellulales bacterium]|nr:dihydropteroate synthase [Pirellulales bacterium]